MATPVVYKPGVSFAPTRSVMTASNRPTVDLRAFEVIQSVSRIADEVGAEDQPSDAAKSEAIGLLLAIPKRLLGAPDIGAFCGEVHIQWVRRDRQVIVMCFSSRSPLVHHYERRPGGPSDHGVELARIERVAAWLEWLHL